MAKQLRAEQLRRVASEIFQGAGTPKDIADYVAGSLVSSNLMGHDSHGVIRVPRYVELISTGTIVPGARGRILHETANTAVVSGNWGFGQVAAKYGTEVAIRKATESQVSVVGVVQINHVGRLGEFAAMIAEAKMIGMVVTGGFVPPYVAVAPYGGASKVLGTNPYAFAVPAGERDPILVDFATSVVAEGKLQVARAKGTPLPPGIVQDKDGNPSTNAEDFYAGGTILPFGGHKGYALSLMADMLGSLLPGADALGLPDNKTGTFMLAINVDAFRGFAEFAGAVDRRLAEVKAVPPAAGFSEVLVPGEPEVRTRAERARDGIPLPDNTWEALVETGRRLGLDVVRLLS